MAIKRKDKLKNTRPYWTVEVQDARQVYRSIADGKLNLNIAPINLNAAERWAHENLTPDCEPKSTLHGLKFTIKKGEEVKKND